LPAIQKQEEASKMKIISSIIKGIGAILWGFLELLIWDIVFDLILGIITALFSI